MFRPSLRAALPLALAAAALAAPPAYAAQVTDVADAADKDNPIDLNLDIRWRRLSQSAKVKREFYDAGRLATIDATELDYSRVTHLMDLNIALGVYHDLELHANLPYAITDEQSWGYATVDGASVADKSSLANNRLTPDGNCITADCATTRAALVSPGKVFRGGFVDPSIGFAWGLLGNAREEKLPEKWYPPKQREATWVLGFDYTMPVTSLQEPHKTKPDQTDGSLVLPMGQGTHRLDWWMAMSKRVGIVDPFFRIHYTLPIASSNAYDNCAAANNDTDGSVTTTAMRNVCKDDATFDPGFYWKGKTGLQPQHRGGMLAGAEFTPVEDKEKDLRFVVGFQIGADFVSKGRTYTEISDALHRLTYSDQYFMLDGRLTIDLRFSKYLHWTSFMGIGTSTPHFITAESVGKDRYGAKTEDPPDGLVTLGSAEVNPNYDFRFDQPGRRLRVTEISQFSASTALAITF